MFARLLLRFACCSALTLAFACGDDKGGTEATSDPSTTAMTTTMGMTTTAGTTTAATDNMTGPGSATDPTGGPSSGMFCIEECSADADCKAMGMDLGLTCQNNVCSGGSSSGCTDNLDCTATFSGWAIPCMAHTDCPNQLCIKVGSEGKCATAPGMGINCADFGQVELMIPPFEGGADVTVCGNTSYECKDAACTLVCKSDADCIVPGLPKCNTGTGLCECTSDTDCTNTGIAGLVVCKTNFCGCGADADCANNPNADTCYDGVCGCSADSTCTTQAFDGTTISCKPF